MSLHQLHENKSKDRPVLQFFVGVTFILFAVVGWINNIILLVDAGSLDWLVAFRVLGVVLFPLGIVLGFI